MVLKRKLNERCKDSTAANMNCVRKQVKSQLFCGATEQKFGWYRLHSANNKARYSAIKFQHFTQTPT
jgi:hypothetical protein